MTAVSSALAVTTTGVAATQPIASRALPPETHAATLTIPVPSVPSVTLAQPSRASPFAGIADLGQQLTRVDGGLEHALEELVGADRALALRLRGS